MKHLKTFNENLNFQQKTIMNLFICEYESPNWDESVKIFNSLDLPTSVEISKGHHLGLSFQILLDTNLQESEKTAKEILTKFPELPLIVISEVDVEMKDIPIGYYFDKDLWEPGRYFDRLVSERKKGLFIY